MTVEEIKDNITMPDLARQYGIHIRNGSMASCPFHGEDRHPSMKIYKDSFHCFACNRSGDIFKFVMEMDGVDFKTAFYQLGGTYEHEKTSDRIRTYRAQKNKETREAKVEKLRRKHKEALKTLFVCQDLLRNEPEGLEKTAMHHEIVERYYQAIWEVDDIDEEIELAKGYDPPKTEKQRLLDFYHRYDERTPEYYQHFRDITEREKGNHVTTKGL